jgi:hypothetical protein
MTEQDEDYQSALIATGAVMILLTHGGAGAAGIQTEHVTEPDGKTFTNQIRIHIPFLMPDYLITVTKVSEKPPAWTGRPDLSLQGETNAQVWARTFWDLWGDRLQELDFSTMLTWFANAIETTPP